MSNYNQQLNQSASNYAEFCRINKVNPTRDDLVAHLLGDGHRQSDHWTTFTGHIENTNNERPLSTRQPGQFSIGLDVVKVGDDGGLTRAYVKFFANNKEFLNKLSKCDGVVHLIGRDNRKSKGQRTHMGYTVADRDAYEGDGQHWMENNARDLDLVVFQADKGQVWRDASDASAPVPPANRTTPVKKHITSTPIGKKPKGGQKGLCLDGIDLDDSWTVERVTVSKTYVRRAQ